MNATAILELEEWTFLSELFFFNLPALNFHPGPGSAILLFLLTSTRESAVYSQDNQVLYFDRSVGKHSMMGWWCFTGVTGHYFIKSPEKCFKEN